MSQKGEYVQGKSTGSATVSVPFIYSAHVLMLKIYNVICDVYTQRL